MGISEFNMEEFDICLDVEEPWSFGTDHESSTCAHSVLNVVVNLMHRDIRILHMLPRTGVSMSYSLTERP